MTTHTNTIHEVKCRPKHVSLALVLALGLVFVCVFAGETVMHKCFLCFKFVKTRPDWVKC